MEKKIKEVYSKKEIEDGKFLAVLSYIGFLALFPYFLEKNNRFVMFHAKQGMNLFLLELICSVILGAMGIFIWLLWPLIWAASSLLGLLVLVLSILGIVNACNGEAKELPFIDKYKVLK